MFVSSACMEAHTHTYSHTLTILGRGPDPQCPLSALDRVYKSALYTLHTHTLRFSALSVCVCGGGGGVGVCASQGTFSSFYYFKHRDQYLFLSVQT